jgi:hypothetical protein
VFVTGTSLFTWTGIWRSAVAWFVGAAMRDRHCDSDPSLIWTVYGAVVYSSVSSDDRQKPSLGKYRRARGLRVGTHAQMIARLISTVFQSQILYPSPRSAH